MWADTLLAIERAHVLRLMLWGALAVAIGAAVLLVLRARRSRPEILHKFAVQNVTWGLMELLLGAIMFWALAPRDLERATKLIQMLRVEVGLTAGAAVIGVTLVFVGWQTGRRGGMVGAGTAVALHGVALLLLHLRTLRTISVWM